MSGKLTLTSGGEFDPSRREPLDNACFYPRIQATRLMLDYYPAANKTLGIENRLFSKGALDELPRRKRRGIKSFEEKRIAAGREVSDPIWKNELGYPRSHVHVDHVACLWLITRFIDNKAECLFVPKNQVASRRRNWRDSIRCARR
jgi:hypothetical protein